MTLTARLTRTAARWRSATTARRALSAQVYGEHRRASDLVESVIARDGTPGVYAMAGTWCEAILADVPRRIRRSAARGECTALPVLTLPDGTDCGIEGASPEVRWAGRLLAAHAAADWAMCRDLIDAVPRLYLPVHLAVLLSRAADATVTRLEDRW